MIPFFTRRWFLITLVVVLLGGIAAGPRLAFLAASWQIRYLIVAVVLFLMALPLQADAMWQAMRRPWAPLLAVAVNVGLLPLVAWGVAKGLSPEMAGGLLVAAATPSTLASASVWTRRAGGNDSVSILVTIITNLSCFVVTPFWLWVLIGQTADSEALALGSMVLKLGMVVVLPMTIAQLFRLHKPIADWASEQKTTLGVLSQCGILSMIFLGSIRTGTRLFGENPVQIGWSDFLLMVVAVMGIHLLMFAVGMKLASWCGIARADRIAVGFAGSQKTLMVGLQVAMDCGLSILPMVTYHVGQLFVDTIIADRMRDAGEKKSTLVDASPECASTEVS